MTARGEHNGQSKLSERDVRAIRLLHKHQLYTLPELAALFDVSRESICKIVARKTWAHVK